jgi:hypothetical protein
MDDRYTPAPPGTATCPHCCNVLTGAPTTTALQFATLRWQCPTCGNPWCELRQAGHTTVMRAWEDPPTRHRRPSVPPT